MRFLILGGSSFARRRLIPTLSGMTTISALAVASQSGQALPANIPTYPDYLTALKEFQPDVVYISLINSLHFFWAKQALKQNIHVIVDKPAFLSLVESEEALDLAKKQRVCIAEALIYEYHPQIDSIKNFMLERKARLKQLIAEFSFPPQKNENFRNYYALGGGAINDLGSYATSIGRIFFGGGPLHSTFQLTDFHPETSVDTSFSVMEQYENGQGYIGAFGFNTQYRNRVSFLCDKLVIDVDRIFTTETTSHNTLFITEGTNNYTYELPASDAMRNFLDVFFLCIKEKRYDDFYNKLLDNARHMHQLRHTIIARNTLM